MKFRIWEKLLLEVIGESRDGGRLVDEIEASCFSEAYKIAKQNNPNLGAIRIDNLQDDAVLENRLQGTAIEFENEPDINEIKDIEQKYLK